MGKTVNGKPTLGQGGGNQIAGMVGGVNQSLNQGDPNANGNRMAHNIGQPQPQNDISQLVGAVNQGGGITDMVGAVNRNLGQQPQPQLFQPFQQLPPPPPPQINPAQANPGFQAPPPQQQVGPGTAASQAAFQSARDAFEAQPTFVAPPPQQGGQLDSFFNGNSSLGQVQQMQPFFNGQQSLGQVQQGVPPPSPFGVSPDPGQVEQSKARLLAAFQSGALSLGQVQAIMDARSRGQV